MCAVCVGYYSSPVDFLWLWNVGKPNVSQLIKNLIVSNGFFVLFVMFTLSLDQHTKMKETTDWKLQFQSNIVTNIVSIFIKSILRLKVDRSFVTFFSIRPKRNSPKLLNRPSVFFSLSLSCTYIKQYRQIPYDNIFVWRVLVTNAKSWCFEVSWHRRPSIDNFYATQQCQVCTHDTLPLWRTISCFSLSVVVPFFVSPVWIQVVWY